MRIFVLQAEGLRGESEEAEAVSLLVVEKDELNGSKMLYLLGCEGGWQAAGGGSAEGGLF